MPPQDAPTGIAREPRPNRRLNAQTNVHDQQRKRESEVKETPVEEAVNLRPSKLLHRHDSKSLDEEVEEDPNKTDAEGRDESGGGDREELGDESTGTSGQSLFHRL